MSAPWVRLGSAGITVRYVRHALGGNPYSTASFGPNEVAMTVETLERADQTAIALLGHARAARAATPGPLMEADLEELRVARPWSIDDLDEEEGK